MLDMLFSWLFLLSQSTCICVPPTSTSTDRRSPRTIKDHTLFNKMCLVVSRIKTHHTPHRWQSGDRKISNGKGSVGRQHLLQLQRPLTELWTSAVVTRYPISTSFRRHVKNKRLSRSKTTTTKHKLIAIFETTDDSHTWKDSQTNGLFSQSKSGVISR